jgi:predicted O-linked N-acetylglucosamine transferase (SPINDLY family)
MLSDINFLINKVHKSLENKDEIQAINFLNEILLIDPLNFNANHIKGVILGAKGEHKLAKIFLKKAAEIERDNYFAQFNYAKSLLETGDDDEAIFYHKNAIRVQPNSKEAWVNYGKSLWNLKDYYKALDCYDCALKIDQNFIEALINKSGILIHLRKYSEALTVLDNALLLNSSEVKICLNRGIAFTRLDLNEEALLQYNKVIETDHNCYEAYYYKALVLFNLKNYEDSFVFFKKALSFRNNINFLFGDFIYSKMSVCDWDFFNENISELQLKIKNKELVIEPLALKGLIDSPELELITTQNYVRFRYLDYLKKDSKFIKKSKSSKIRLGYYSSDFNKYHPVAFLTSQIFEEHNKDLFEVFAFSFAKHDEKDEFQKRIIDSFDKFIHCKDLSNLEIVNLSKELKLDIAIDLNGYTKDNRAEIFFERVAPIQVNYLGYPGTMASKSIDYIVSDNVVISKSNKEFFNEKIVYLPNSYPPNDKKKIISEKIFVRTEFGLKDDQFVFCCFNNNFKITPIIFDVWMKILSRANNSVIWLLEKNFLVSKNLKKEAEKRGVSSTRLIFSKRIDLRPEYLARQRLADLFLDTFPYNAHSTSCDALFMGLPVLTLIGNSFQSRIGASLLYSVGISELIAKNLKEYEDLAVELATNKEKIFSIKEKLKNNVMKESQLNAKLFTQNLEKAYAEMFNNYSKGILPQDIIIN